MYNERRSSQSEGQQLPYLDTFYAVTSAEANYYSSSIHLIQTRSIFLRNHFITFMNIRICPILVLSYLNRKIYPALIKTLNVI